VKKSSFEVGDWVLVRTEDPQKLQSNWLLKAHVFETYALTEPNSRVLRNLVNGQGLLVLLYYLSLPPLLASVGLYPKYWLASNLPRHGAI
jgi:hypothetical protein